MSPSLHRKGLPPLPNLPVAATAANGAAASIAPVPPTTATPAPNSDLGGLVLAAQYPGVLDAGLRLLAAMLEFNNTNQTLARYATGTRIALLAHAYVSILSFPASSALCHTCSKQCVVAGPCSQGERVLRPRGRPSVAGRRGTRPLRAAARLSAAGGGRGVRVRGARGAGLRGEPTAACVRTRRLGTCAV